MIRTNRRFPSLTIAAACCFAVVATSRAADDAKPERRARYESLKNDYDRLEAESIKALRARANPDEPVKPGPSVEDYGKRFMTLARENPADDSACDSLVWAATHRVPQEVLDEALGLLEKHHLQSAKLKPVVAHLGFSEAGARLIDRLTTEGANPEVRGPACLFRAIQRYSLYFSFRKSDPKELAEIERLLTRVEKEYADIRFPDDGMTLGQLAKGWLYEVRYLQPGMKAPEIVGTGVDGKPMKLGDYRGKVVLLVFWSSTCGPCLAEVPEHRKLMTDFAGRPFTIVGVCCGDTKEQAAKTMAQEQMTWPSFLDGDLGEGTICRQWNVDGIPTVYLIDAAGVIRRSRHFGLQEEADVLLFDHLLRQAEAK